MVAAAPSPAAELSYSLHVVFLLGGICGESNLLLVAFPPEFSPEPDAFASNFAGLQPDLPPDCGRGGSSPTERVWGLP